MIRIAAIAALSLCIDAHTPSLARNDSTDGAYPPWTRHRHRLIVITPRPQLYYRRCRDWLELQYRPSGAVLFPQYRCWWVRGLQLY